MTQEDKVLLLKDLCARLPYHIIVFNGYENAICRGIDNLDKFDNQCILLNFFNPEDDEGTNLFEDVKPYLRPMSSMTKEERQEYNGFIYNGGIGSVEYFDWINKHHFDYRGLIEKGLALEAPKGMYQ